MSNRNEANARRGVDRSLDHDGIGRVTRRKVRLIRPPSGNSIEVPGMMRSTPWKASRACRLSTTASPEASRNERGCIATAGAANPKQAGVAERQRDHRRREILLVAILMQAHLGRQTVLIDEAAFERMWIAAKLLPSLTQGIRNRGPSLPGLRMGGLIAVAEFVGDPAKRPAVGHANRHRPRGSSVSAGYKTGPERALCATRPAEPSGFGGRDSPALGESRPACDAPSCHHLWPVRVAKREPLRPSTTRLANP